MIGKFQMQVIELSENIKSLILEQMRNPQRAELIEGIIRDCERQMGEIRVKIDKLKTSETIERNARVNMKTSIEILEEIISKKCIDNAHLQRSLSKRLEFHYTPKHGSWLNIAEIELSALSR